MKEQKQVVQLSSRPANLRGLESLRGQRRRKENERTFRKNLETSLLGARTLLIAPGLTTRSKKLLGTRSNIATRNIRLLFFAFSEWETASRYLRRHFRKSNLSFVHRLGLKTCQGFPNGTTKKIFSDGSEEADSRRVWGCEL